jgi:hypothetical protein
LWLNRCRYLRHRDVQEIALPGERAHHPPFCVAEGTPDVTDAMEEAVLRHADIRPDGIKKLRLGQHLPRMAGKHSKESKRLGTKGDVGASTVP